MALIPQKARVTRTRNVLDNLLRKETEFTQPINDGEDSRQDQLEVRWLTVKKQIQRLDDAIAAHEDALEKLYATNYELDMEQQQAEAESLKLYQVASDDILQKADTMRERLRDIELEIDIARQKHRLQAQAQMVDLFPAQLDNASRYQPPLPRIEIPTFSGNVWEWENFWKLFKCNVNDQPIAKMLKFNYLLRALQGDAKEAIMRFQMTESNYDEAIRWLQRRYGNDETVIDQLYKRLEDMKAEGPSTRQQRKLLDQVATTMAQLATKKQDVNHRQLLTQIFRKFDNRIQKKLLEIKSQLQSQDEWNWDTFYLNAEDIITKRELIENMQAATNGPSPSFHSYTHHPQGRRQSQRVPECLYCKQTAHRSVDCQTVPLPERAAFFHRNHLCKNCGSPDHDVDTCNKNGCRICGRKHHTSLHNPHLQAQQHLKGVQNRYQGNNGNPQHAPAESYRRKPAPQNSVSRPTEDDEATTPEEDCQPTLRISKGSHKRVQLLTGLATIVGPTRSKKTRILLDTGSELSFIHSSIADELKLQCVGQETLRLTTFGSTQVQEKKYDKVLVNLKDIEGSLLQFTFFKSDIITKYAAMPRYSDEDIDFIEKQNIKLHQQEAVDPQILLGCDQLWRIMKNQIIELPSGLHLISTSFGFMTSGIASESADHTNPVMLTSEEENERRKWENYLTFESSYSQEFSGPQHLEKQRINQQVLKKFNETIIKKEDGYYVRLPWKENRDSLPDNRRIAEARLQGLFRTYRNNPQFLQDYDKIFKDQFAKGILEIASNTPQEHGKIVHYLAHHAVITPEKKTTPRRIVFDASAHYRNKPSLNDVLHQGPLILPKLAGMVMRFRTGKIAITSDVEKAFLQVRLQEEDRDATRCLWVKDITKQPSRDNIVIYRFTRVTFGINASPFLLAATIKFHLNSSREDPFLLEEINRNLYVDNLFMGAESTEEALKKYQATKRIFSDLSMNLREFQSNDTALNSQISSTDKSSVDNPKILGIKWDTTTDTLDISSHQFETKTITKRAILTALASVYDPLGWLTPIMLKTKIFFQRLWTKDYDWDTVLSFKDCQKWKRILSETQNFAKRLPRRIADKATSHNIAVFADASTSAMCAVAYLCHKDNVNILIARSRLPKQKETHTVPKLELNALTMAARLALWTFEELNKSITVDSIQIFTDSKIVINWLRNPTLVKDTGRLVTNRIKEIKAIAEELQKNGVVPEFGYVNTTNNPADIGTRGVSAKDFEHHMWWTGPNFLQQTSNQWPMENMTFTLNPEPMEVNVVNQSSNGSNNWPFDEERFSSLEKLERTAALALRFIANASKNLPETTKRRLEHTLPEMVIQKGTEPLKASNLKQVRKLIWKLHQKRFKETILSTANNNLNIKKAEDGIYKCFGRLGNSQLENNAKYPIIIAPDSKLAKLVIQKAHGQYHCAVAHTMANVRQQFWIPRLRQQVKAFIRRCLPCQKYNNLPFRYPEAQDLPSRRVLETRPFLHVGMDLFGPLHLKEDAKNKDNPKKAYGMIFTCAATRLVHLDLLPDASTPSVINAMRRFIARRGVPASITCDNAPSFKLGQEIFSESLANWKRNDDVQHFLTTQDIEWKFITPYAPWKGGFYERLIQSIKRAMYKAIGKKKLDFETMTTLLVEVEACLNCRPLTYIESEIEERPDVRPIDFIQRNICLTYPLELQSEDNDQDAEYRPPEDLAQLRTRNQTLEALESSYKLTRKFWDVWRSGYLTELRAHHRKTLQQGRSSPKEPRIGQIVLIINSSSPRNAWILGKIVKMNSPAEVELLSFSGRIIKRPINLLIPLELDNDPSEEILQDTREEDENPEAGSNLRRSRKEQKRREEPVSERREYPDSHRHIANEKAGEETANR